MGRRRKLKKACSDLKVQEQNVAASKLAIEEQNVVPLELAIREQIDVGIEEPKVDETSSQCNLEFDMVIVSNLSDEIPPKTNWEF
jgi:hypothetical protein